MKFIVLNYLSAQKFAPRDPTLAIRIFDPEGGQNTPDKKLLESDMWVGELHYTFSDIDLCIYEECDPHLAESLKRTSHCFDASMAQQLVSDFSKVKDKTSTVLLHCNAGISRSPAVALALCKKFGIKPEWFRRRTQGLMSTYEKMLAQGKRAANSWVYHLILDV